MANYKIYSKHMQIRVTPKQRKLIGDIAFSKGHSLNAFIRSLIDKEIEKNRRLKIGNKTD